MGRTHQHTGTATAGQTQDSRGVYAADVVGWTRITVCADCGADYSHRSAWYQHSRGMMRAGTPHPVARAAIRLYLSDGTVAYITRTTSATRYAHPADAAR